MSHKNPCYDKQQKFNKKGMGKKLYKQAILHQLIADYTTGKGAKLRIVHDII